MTKKADSRQYQRVPITYQVKLVVDDRIIAYPQAINLSLGGILLGGPELLEVGSQCGVAILLANGDAGGRVVARGTVVRNDERGMAIAFSKALDKGSLASLQELIDSLGDSPDNSFDLDLEAGSA